MTRNPKRRRASHTLNLDAPTDPSLRDLITVRHSLVVYLVTIIAILVFGYFSWKGAPQVTTIGGMAGVLVAAGIWFCPRCAPEIFGTFQKVMQAVILGGQPPTVDSKSSKKT